MSDTLNTLLDEMAGMHPLPAPRPDVVETVTPSGVTIRYEDKRHFYFIDGVRVPSVSKILGCLDKPALPWWGMKIGVEGTLKLIESDPAWAVESVDAVVKGLTAAKLTCNHVRDKAGDRGTTVHDALEAWARTGTLANPAVYPDEQAGYVTALNTFISATVIEPEAVEVIVGSITHKFAGRYDLRCSIDGKPVLLDLKTSGAVYPEHFLQLEAYEGASVECGYEPTDRRLVLRVGSDGTFEVRESVATYEDFLAVKSCYDATSALQKRAKAA